MNSFSSVFGALMYTFCSFVLFSFVRHPYFSLAVVLYPLLLLGIERFVQEKKWGFYVFIVAFTAITNFYFAYSMFLILAIYGVLLVVFRYKALGIKTVFFRLFELLGYSILGVLLASFLLVPTIYSFFHSARLGGMEIFPYASFYYKNFLPSLITTENGYWRYFGVQSIVLLTLPIFIRNRKKNYPLYGLMLFLLLPLLFSKIGSIFVGMSYANSRWSYAFSFFFSFITASFLNEERSMDKKDFFFVSCFLTVYFLGIFLVKSTLNPLFLCEFVLFLIFLFLFTFRNELIQKVKSFFSFHLLLLCCLLGGIFYTCSYLYDVNGINYVSQFINFNAMNTLYSTNYGKNSDFSSALDFIQNNDTDFYRIGMNSTDIANLALVKNYHSLPYFYSIVPNEYLKLAMDIENRDFYINKEFMNFDYRTQITTLLGNKYYITTNQSVPFGYEKMKNYSGTSNVYQNQYTLPFGVLYTSYLKEEDYEHYHPIMKEHSYMNTTVLSEKDIEHISIDSFDGSMKSVQKLESTIQENSILNHQTIEIKPNGSKTLKLQISDFKNSELYLYVSNFRFTPYNKEEKIAFEKFSIKDIHKKKNDIARIEYKYQDYRPSFGYSLTAKFQGKSLSENTLDLTNSAYYFENFDYVMNFGYFKENKDRIIELTFPKEGYYTFDEISVIAVSMDDYPNHIEQLKRSNFTTIEYGSGYLKGTVDAEESGVLQFATTYSDGWDIYVDGEKVPSLVSNQHFLGTSISKGYHEIVLRYHTPWLKEGIIISIISGFLCIFVSFFQKRKLKSR